MNAYLMHGLHWSSEVDLHLPLHEPAADPDVVLRRGECRPSSELAPSGRVLARQPRDSEHALFTFVEQDDGQVVLRFHRLGDIEVSADLREATWFPEEQTDEDFVSVLVNGLLATVLLVLRGHPVLHGSAVEVDGDAVALVGASGMGKSTLSALLCRAGGALLTDDVLRVDAEGSRYVVRSGGVENRLREGARHLAGTGARNTADGRTAVPAARLARDRVPLSLLAVPYPSRDRDEVVVDRLAPPAALVELLRFPRIVQWSHAATLQEHFALVAGLVRAVPVVRLYIPWQDVVGDEITPALVAAIKDILMD